MSETCDIAGLHLKLDCRHYRGEKPCTAGHDDACPHDCGDYDATGPRVLIIKLGALGDVLRSEVLLDSVRTFHPRAHITWVTRPSGVQLLANNLKIDRLLPFNAETVCCLEHERFDLCLSLDKEAAPCSLAMRVQCEDKRGIGWSPAGAPYPLNDACVPYFRLGLSDHLKFNVNRASYPELICQAVGLPHLGRRYRLYPNRADRERASAVLTALHLPDDKPIVGLNTGAGKVFANKIWTPDRFVTLADRLSADGNVSVLLLGGPEEREQNPQIARACTGRVFDAGCDHDALVFAAIVEQCRAIVAGDSLAMHVGVAMSVPTIVLFGPTCPQEIDLFGRGEKIVTDIECSPCYLRQCDKQPNCMDRIRVDAVYAAVHRWIDRTSDRAHPVFAMGVQ